MNADLMLSNLNPKGIADGDYSICCHDLGQACNLSLLINVFLC